MNGGKLFVLKPKAVHHLEKGEPKHIVLEMAGCTSCENDRTRFVESPGKTRKKTRFFSRGCFFATLGHGELARTNSKGLILEFLGGAYFLRCDPRV